MNAPCSLFSLFEKTVVVILVSCVLTMNDFVDVQITVNVFTLPAP